MKSMRHYLKTFFVLIPGLAFNLSKHPLNAIWLSVKLWVFLVGNKLFDVEMFFDFQFLKTPFRLRLISGIDVAVLAEVFVLKEYEWELDFDPKVIVDLGAHWGDSSIFYAMRYPDAMIYAVEPAPDMFARLQQVVSQFKNITPVNLAVSDRSGEAEFFVSENSLGNSLQKRSESDKRVMVRSVSLVEFKKMYGIKHIDVLKFDIEGAEEQLLKAEGLNKEKALIGELHFDLINLSKDDIKSVFAATHDVSMDFIAPERSIIKAVKHGA